MFKINVLLLFHIIVYVNSISLCGRTKIDGYCWCSKEVSDATGFLELHIDCSSAKLAKFPDSKEIPAKIVAKLDVSHNDLIELTFNEIDFTSRSLRDLRASYNKITTIGDEFLSALPNLEYLDLSHNEIANVKTLNLPSLKHLDFSFNEIKTISNSLDNMPNLRYLDLSYNDLGEFLRNLKHLGNKLLGLSTNVTNLQLNSVNFEDVPSNYFENYTHLHRLELADNNLRQIPKIPDNVKYLDISGNLFVTLEANDLNYKALKSLKLNRLHLLENIGHYAFYTMSSLESLELTNCPKLMELNPLAFGLLTQQETLGLKKLHLAGNNLRKWNITYQYLVKSLDEVTLHNNPWVCDCDIQWMYLQFDKIRYSEQVRCAAPTRLRNRPVHELQASDFTYCTNSRSKQMQRILVPTLIVLILILMPLIAYLVIKGPITFKNLGNRRLGPQSPYEGIPTTPRDA